jgi:type IV pilus assembly protein PilV
VNRKGFTLVEVMIGLVILAIALLGIAGMQLIAIRANHSSDYVTSATVLAKSQLEYLKNLPYTNPALDGGTHAAAGVTVPQPFSMSYNVVVDAGASTKTIVTTVSWTDWGGHSISLKTLRFQG